MKHIKVERIKLSEHRDNPLNSKIFNEVPPEKYAALKDYIRRNGLLKPLIVNNQNIIIGGHVRARICKELGIEIVTVQRIQLDRKKEDELLIKDNILGRTLSPIEIARAGLHLEAMAQKWQRNGDSLRNLVAKRLGVSHTQYSQTKAILAHADTDLIGRVNNGQVSVARAYSIIRHQRDKAKAFERAMAEPARFRLVNEDPLSVLANFRPESCDVILAEPPEAYDPVWIDLAARSLKRSGHLAILTEDNFKAVAGAQDAGLHRVASIAILGKSREDGKLVRNHKLFVWLSRDAQPKIPVDRLSTTWDFRMQEDQEHQTMKRIMQLTAPASGIVVHLFGKNLVMEQLAPLFKVHVFAVQPDKDAFVREKLRL
jgi:ParB-like chromosome segregation protein Spo0J